MAKKVKAVVKLQVDAGKANPAPPVGPALGQYGVNIMEFCKKYNEATAKQMGNIIPVEITVFEDRTFTFVTKTPPAAALLLKAASVEKGSGDVPRVRAGKVSRSNVEEIAKVKMPDLNANDLSGAVKIIEGTARSMGMDIAD